jgi:hypothetical protein
MGTKSTTTEERRRKVQAELVGSFVGEVEAIEEMTGTNMTFLIKQGLARVAKEFRETGRIETMPLQAMEGH